MTDQLEILKRIDARLEQIQQLLARRPLSDVLAKPSYACQEVAQLSQTHGVQSYRDFTVRLACNDGRVPEAEKRVNGNWSIPRHAVERILQEGLPPERRKARSREPRTNTADRDGNTRSS